MVDATFHNVPFRADACSIAGDLIVGDIVDLQSVGVDVAQDQVGCAGSMDRRRERTKAAIAEQRRFGALLKILRAAVG